MTSIHEDATTSSALSESFASRRILVIEDNREGRETLCLVLERWGHCVEKAENGLQGIQKALTWQPEVAVVDIGLPIIDGYEVARRVRQAMQDRIYLIALTGYCQMEDRRRAFEAGFDVHMPKPADLDELYRLLTA
jgi:CheY-like chemotaxis protein